MKPLNIVGFDPSLTHWGMSKGIYENQLHITEVGLIIPDVPKIKGMRQGEKDIIAASQLYTEAHAFAEGADIICIEVPTGSQSARAMVSYAVCITVISTFYAQDATIVAVTPQEAKNHVGNPKATKSDVIHWIQQKHPEIVFPTYKRNGELRISESQAEHMADSVLAIHTAMSKSRFHELADHLRNT